MDKIRKKKSDDSGTAQDWLSTIFLLYMGTLYPLIMHDKYFDITLTKYKAFEVALCVYAVLMVLAVLLDVFDGKKPFVMFKYRKSYVATDWFMAGFFVANVLAFVMASDKMAAYTGEEGRRCGLQFMILAMLLYVCMGRSLRLRKCVFPAFLCVGSFTCIIAVFQYVGIDFLGIRDGLASSIMDIYISTFGNIDIFASFLCVLIPVGFGVGLDDRRIYDGDATWKFNWVKLSAWTAVFTGAAATVVTNADLAYAGVCAAAAILLLVSTYRGRIKEFVELMLVMSLGFLAVSLLLKTTPESIAKLDGISNFARNTELIAVASGVLAVIRIVIYAVSRLRLSRKDSNGNTFNRSGKISLVVCSVLVIAGIVCAVIFSSVKADGIFRFDDSWGNYRGYVWSRLVSTYKEFPLVNKLFGYGNESVKSIMTAGYYDEMISKVGVVYDNAHNEYLQYLVTTGVLGAVTYVGLIVSAFVSMIRTAFSSSDYDFCACIAVALGIASYAVQALFNLNQSLTTPYIFLLAAMAAGIGRRLKLQRK